jgi:hypothetical protein
MSVFGGQVIIQLSPPIPVITPKGKAMAHLVIDYGMEADLVWVCFQDQTGECWSWVNKDIKLQPNITFRQQFLKTEA